MMFADDIALSRQNYNEPEEDLEILGNALEKGGLKVKTEYLKVGSADVGEELKLQGDAIQRKKNFTHHGSTVSNDERCDEKVRKMIQEG